MVQELRRIGKGEYAEITAKSRRLIPYCLNGRYSIQVQFDNRSPAMRQLTAIKEITSQINSRFG